MNNKRLITNALMITRDLNQIISIDDILPWSCKNELYFLSIVIREYDYIVIGRITYENLNINTEGKPCLVVTTEPEKYKTKEVNNFYFVTLEDVKAVMRTNNCIVIGGAKLAETLMPLIDKVYLVTILEVLKFPYDKLKVTYFKYNFYRHFIPYKTNYKSSKNYTLDILGRVSK